MKIRRGFIYLLTIFFFFLADISILASQYNLEFNVLMGHIETHQASVSILGTAPLEPEGYQLDQGRANHFRNVVASGLL